MHGPPSKINYVLSKNGSKINLKPNAIIATNSFYFFSEENIIVDYVVKYFVPSIFN
jgi:hypothetical protein